MDAAVFDYSLAEIDAHITPMVDAAAGVQQHAMSYGYNAGYDQPWSWEELRFALDGPLEPPHQTWREYVAEVRSLGPMVSVPALFGRRTTWVESLVRLGDWCRRADQLLHVMRFDPPALEAARAYMAAAIRLWDAVWWFVGWLGRWIRHRIRLEDPTP